MLSLSINLKKEKIETNGSIIPMIGIKIEGRNSADINNHIHNTFYI